MFDSNRVMHNLAHQPTFLHRFASKIYIFFDFVLGPEKGVWFVAQTIAKIATVQNVRLHLLCITVTFDEKYVLPY
jgi:hypothetical protein